MSGDGEEKTHGPSQRRMDEARRKGDIPRSAELVSAAGWLGVLLALHLTGSMITTELGGAGMTLIGQADRLAPDLVEHSRLPAQLVQDITLAIAPLFLLPMAFALLALVAQRGLVFAPDRLMPKMSRISPVANAGQKFGREGIVSFLRSFAKMVVVSAILWIFLSRDIQRIIDSTALEPGQSAALLADILIRFLTLICIVAAVFGVMDYLIQRIEYLRRNRMSRQELADEMKESEGDPHLRAHRRQRARDIATNRMLVDVATAEVVIVNPTHYAVALAWDRRKGRAPVCVAKGVDEIAARIRERAVEAGVPLHPDPPTARALYATVEIGAQIRPEHYMAIAAAIRFADRIGKHRKRKAP